MPGDTPENKADLLRRLRCAEGHLRGIAAMIERGADCQSVVRQMWAVQAALCEINRQVIQHHLAVCLDEYLLSSQADANTHERFLAEVILLYQLLGGSRPPFNQKELL
jgi:DNA-binding FrmR family transcriptional regulator